MKMAIKLTPITPYLSAALIVFLIAGCAAKRPAPVSDSRPPTQSAVTIPVAKSAETVTASPTESGKPVQAIDPSKLHIVQRGDTLYSIAFQHSLDRRELAAWNNIENPNVIRVDDHLRLTPPDAAAVTASGALALKPGEPVTAPLILTPSVGPSSVLEAPLQNSAQMKVEPKAGRVPYTDQAYARLSSEVAVTGTTSAAITIAPTPTAMTPAALPPPVLPAANESIDWAWPVKNKVTAAFTDLSKGIDMAGTRGTAIMAAAPGKIIYNKSGLRGYGRLIIIRHSETWLSAYAHNEKVLVEEDEIVKKGQKIAEMGSSDTDAVKLHFEIRKNGKPVDPLKFLPAQ